MKQAFILFLLFFSLIVFSQQKYSCEIYFDSGKDALTLVSTETLDSLINKISSKNNFTISISGYCDSIGNDKYNYDLSLKRSHSVGKYFFNKNIKTDSLFGFGKTKLKYFKNDWGKNRRAEIVITMIPLIKNVEIHTSNSTKTADETVVNKNVDTTENVIESFIDTAKVGDKLVLQNISFHPGTPEILHVSYKTLEELLTTLKKHPSLNICIEGHVCCDIDYDNSLSRERSLAVYFYLVENGIEEKRLSFKGFGNTQPITQERNAVERQINRRVEIRIVKK